jgi:hypothetical protein
MRVGLFSCLEAARPVAEERPDQLRRQRANDICTGQAISELGVLRAIARGPVVT